MSREPDIRPEETIGFQEAEDAAERLEREIARAKQVLNRYRAKLGDGLSDNDKR
jgi:hypothetical protein